MPIQANTKLADVIHTNYLILPIINRFNIQLGFGDKTVEQVCTEKKVNLHFFLEIINSYLYKDYFPQNELLSFPLQLIIDYISRSHNYYLNLKLPEIERMISNLIEGACETNKKSFRLIQSFFTEYKEELISHIEKEDKEVHPYIIEIDSAIQRNKITLDIVNMVNEQSIDKYASDHDNVEDKLFDLKNLIIKYFPPAHDYSLSNSILFELFRLERDLNDHARIEEKVLVPKVQIIEQQILRDHI